MDLSAILNKNEQASSSNPQRSASISHTNLPPHSPHSPHSQQHITSIARQHSYPGYGDAPQEYYHNLHTQQEYHSEESDGVSPRTRPTSLPHDSGYMSVHISPEMQHRPEFGTTSTPARIHVRGTSSHSIGSTVSNHNLDQVAPSPSPVQSRQSLVSPLENPQMPPPQFHPSPIMPIKSMPPPTTPILNSPTVSRTSPPTFQPSAPPFQQSPSQPQQKMKSISPSTVTTGPHPTLTPSPTIESRKRSLESASNSEAPIISKKPRHEKPPPRWARRIEWGQLAPMNKFVPEQYRKQITVSATTLSDPGRLEPKSNIKSRVLSMSDSVVNGNTFGHSQRAWESDLRSTREYSLDNHVPYNEINRIVARFLSNNILVPIPPEVGTVEVEARLGVLTNPDTGRRFQLPIQSEAALDSNSTQGLRFESIMNMEQHKALNEYLNNETRRSRSNSDRKPIDFKHLYEKDTFFELPDEYFQRLPLVVHDIRNQYSRHRPRIRVTKDKAGNITAKIIKLRMDDLQISCPRNNFDVRVSISAEINYQGPIEGLIEQRERGVLVGRIKNRLSYKHQNISVDLTQVVSEGDGSKVHEMELEIDSAMLIEQARLAEQGLENDYEELVGIFLNYVRVVNRACGSHEAFVERY